MTRDPALNRRTAGESLPGSTGYVRCRLVMKPLLSVVVSMMLAGCGPPPPVPKATHINQLKAEIAKAGGVTNITKESRTLFARLSQKEHSAPFYGTEDQCFQDLSGITNLGDVFYFAPDHIHIRIHNSHFDTYFIDLLNPDLPEPKGFERIAGNVGFLR